MPNWKKVIVSGSDASLSTLTITNSGSTDDSLLLTATEDSSTAAPVLTFKRNSGTPADADYLGQLKFKGENDADQEVTYAKITAKILDASDGSEDGLIEFANRKAGSNVITARLRSDSLQLLNDSNLSVDGQISASSLVSNNFSGSFQGDASGLNGPITASSLSTDQYIYHTGDQDTLINFTTNQIRFNAGGINFMSLEKDASTPYPLTVNNGGNRINFRVVDRNSDLLFKTNSEEFWTGLYFAGSRKLTTSTSGITITGSLYTSGSVTASFFSGDGSGLTNLTTNITEEVTVSQTFSNATTSSVTHNFGTKDVIVTVYDNNDDQFIPTRINTPDTNNVNVFMNSATTGRVVVAKGGHLISGSIHKHLMTSVTSSTITHNLQEEFPIVQLYESASREVIVPETIKSIDENNTQVVLSELIDCYVVIKR